MMKVVEKIYPLIPEVLVERIWPLDEMLPAYLNGTLGETEKRILESRLQRDPHGKERLEACRQASSIILSQPVYRPSPDVKNRILSRIHRETAAFPYSKKNYWVIGIPAVLLVWFLLWMVLQPGVVLQWSVQNGDLQGYRVYRAPQGSAQYQLLGEIPAYSGVRQYTYTDLLSWPLGTYTYLVEGVGRAGEIAISQAVPGSGMEALPGQLAILAAGLAAGFSLVLLKQYPIHKKIV